jgi:hypothetical protein
MGAGNLFLWTAVLAVTATTGVVEPAPTGPDLAYAEKTLREAGVGTDGPALLAFFRRRTLSAADRQKLGATVRRLGAQGFAVRKKAFAELLHAGRPALPFLHRAVQDSDPEVARSADRLVKRIEGGGESALVVAAARVLAARKPAGAARALLAYLPMTDEEWVEEAVFGALAAVGLPGGKPSEALTAALKDPDTLRRAAAAYVYGRGGAGPRRALADLLADPNAKVRFHAAMPLVQSGDKQAIPALVSVLADGPDALVFQAEDLLYRLAGDQAPRTTLGTTPAERRRCRQTWEAWWQANAAGVDLAKLRLRDALRGLNVVCECGAGNHPSGYVWEFGPNGKKRWEFDKVNTPVDAFMLRGGNVLVAEWNTPDLTERDRTGKVVWTYRGVGAGRSCQRLANGNTFFATSTALMEVTPDKKLLYRHARLSIFRARKLRNGHILYICGQGHFAELDTTGKEVRKVKLPRPEGAWGDVDLLPNGHYLICLYSGNGIWEIDAAGKVFWHVDIRTPSSVSRLPNGHTLVTSMDAQRVVELDRAGKEVKGWKTPGRPFCVRRY